MSAPKPIYYRYRFPAEIIGHGVWLYHGFSLSFREVEDLLAERGIQVSYESIRQWCSKFGPDYAAKLKRRRGRLGDMWYLDEVLISIRGQRHYLWRAVDQEGDVLDILVQRRRDGRAAKLFFRKLLKGQGSEPRRLVTDKLGSYGAAHRVVMPSVVHDTTQYANNRAELSHEPTRQRERQMRRFKSGAQAQRFLTVQRGGRESVPSRAAPPGGGQSPTDATACLRRVECRDVRVSRTVRTRGVGAPVSDGQ